jgi:hypothetical protein
LKRWKKHWKWNKQQNTHLQKWNFIKTLKKTKKTIKNQDLLKKHCKNIEKNKQKNKKKHLFWNYTNLIQPIVCKKLFFFVFFVFFQCFCNVFLTNLGFWCFFCFFQCFFKVLCFNRFFLLAFHCFLSFVQKLCFIIPYWRALMFGDIPWLMMLLFIVSV